jgi:hypothetical protein
MFTVKYIHIRKKSNLKIVQILKFYVF